MVLRQLQALLVRLYDAPVDYDVNDFLVTERHELQALTGSDRPPVTDEQVLVAETEDGLRVGVFIDGEVLKRLDLCNPLDSLTADNLHDYCTALEGVSHFHYLLWSAARERTVSLLELEVQAEIDKYAAAMLLLTSQYAGRFPHGLHARLFHHVGFAAGLDLDSLHRYQQANRQAARFCRALDDRFLRRRRVRVEGWLAELRRIYRLGHSEKLRLLTA